MKRYIPSVDALRVSDYQVKQYRGMVEDNKGPWVYYATAMKAIRRARTVRAKRPAQLTLSKPCVHEWERGVNPVVVGAVEVCKKCKVFRTVSDS